MHPLLRRLFEEHLGQGTALPPGWGPFLAAVDRAWGGADPGGEEPAVGEATFRALAETISAAVFVYRGTRYVYVNAAATELTGYSAEELLAMNFWELVHPDHRDVIRERGMARQRGDRVPSRYEFRIVRSDGEERWVDFTSATVQYGGEPAALGTAFDVTDRRRASDELRRQLLTLENLSDAVVQTDAAGRITGWNPAATRLYGFAEAEALGRTPELWLPPGDADRVIAEILDTVDREGRWSGEIRLVRRDGSSGITETTVVPVLDERGRLAGTLGVNRDVTERRRAEAALRESEERYRALFEESRDAIYMTGEQGRFEAVNQAALEMFGYAREEMQGMELRALCVDPSDCEVMDAEIARAGFVRDHEVRLRRSDGGVVDCLMSATRRSGEHGGAVQGIVHDISERKRAEAQLAYGAFHDPLTGLPNRALFLDRLAHAVERVRRQGGTALAVLFLDLDRFKVINDSLGHGTGDELLRAIGARLGEALRPGDTAARFGGDEFTVLLEGVGDALTATHVAQRVLDSLARPFHLSRSEVYTSASAGIALHSGGAASPDELLRSAGTALGRAKARGRARCEVFDRAMHAEAMDRLQMEMDLRPAAERGELRLVYQPVVSLPDGGISGFEALLRWEHPTRGRVLPEQFVPVAEETGLIVPIGEWVLEQACRQLRRWRERFPERRVTVGVNLSPRQFSRPELVDRVREILAETEVEPSALRLEITESLLIEHAEPTATMLARLREAGVGLCMDDFGTGYSSLSYLHRFPLDTLKIDRSFVMRVGNGGDAEPIVRTIAALAHNLGLKVVAEGVETAAQLEELRTLRCEYAQGFLFSPPLDVEEVDRLLEDDPRW